MKRLLNKDFHVSEHSKISEKAILLRLATTIAVIIFCLFAMSTTAFAYFSHDITSRHNIIKTANFEVSVSVQIKDSTGATVPVNTDNRIAPCADIKADTTYFVTIKHSERSTAKTGFVIITADRCESRYHTQQLGKDANGNTETFTFTITPNNDTRVTFLSHWGTSSYYGYKNTDNPLYITEKNKDIKLSVTPPLMLKPLESTAPETTAKAPTPTDTQKPTVPSTELIAPETTSPETVITVTETTVYEPPISETTAPVTTVPETIAPATTVLETSAPELPRKTQAETNPYDSPETSGEPTKEAN